MARADGGCVGPLTVTPPGRSQAKANSPDSALRQPGGLRTSLCRTFPNFLALSGQTRPGRVTVTKCRFTARPRPGNENLPLPQAPVAPPRSHLPFADVPSIELRSVNATVLVVGRAVINSY